MKNDKERKAFVENADNWIETTELNDKMRVVKLTYQGKEWYRIQILRNDNYYDYDSRELKKRIDWVTLETCQFSSELGVFGDHWSNTNIVDAIKTLDREAK